MVDFYSRFAKEMSGIRVNGLKSGLPYEYGCSLTLGIVFKGPEGIVLAVDSRVTLTSELRDPNQDKIMLLPSTYDNATKLLRVKGQDFVGAITYGLGAIGQRDFRTAHSLVPEFEHELEGSKRLSVREFAKKLSDFYLHQWNNLMPKDYKGEPMIFLVGGYDERAAYGRIFEVIIPTRPEPEEWNAEDFGVVWGGQREFTDRIIQGFDPGAPSIIQKSLALGDDQMTKLVNDLRSRLGVHIPYPFLPLQDCVDLAIFLIRTTITIQGWIAGVRGVGGAIDVATITRTEGFKSIQQKTVLGERKL